MSPKVWCIGMPRTGTTSFIAALKILGYTNIKHNPDFADLKNLDGASDAGCAAFYKYLYYRHPDSKFVLTTRDLSTWIPSIMFLLERTKNMGTGLLKNSPVTYEDWLLRRSLLLGMGNVEKEYKRHCREVREFFADKPGALIEMDITAADGWAKLCEHLDLPIPPVPFPCKHSVVRPRSA